LRYKVLDVLTSNKDTFAQDKLLDWLQHLDQSPISASTALQLLGNDIHAGIYPVAKQVLDNPPDHAARLEALRLLASDGESQEYFKELLHNRAEPVDVRRIAASAVKSLTPDQFKEQALAIVKDEDEDDSLRATMLAGIAHSSDFLDDDDLRASVQEVCDSTQSTYIRTISDKYLTRTSNPVLKQYNEIRKNRSR
jgi:uncharacterized membrane-anchored protein YjiN (DUF445 family)